MTRFTESLALMALVGAAMAAIGCSEEGAPGGVEVAPVGEERGPCFGNGTCFEGLVCASDLCVRPPEGLLDAGPDAPHHVDPPAPDAEGMDAEVDAEGLLDAAEADAPDDADEAEDADPSDASSEDAASPNDADPAEDVADEEVADDADPVGDGGDPGPQAPEVRITHPGEEVRRAGVEILFTGFAVDPQEGELGPDRLEWRSEPGGFMFAGGRGLRIFDTPGVYTITLTATDAQGNQGATSLRLRIQGPQDPIATILHPADGDPPRASNVPVLLRGEGEDPQDGRLPPDRLEWRAEPGGFLFRGRQSDRVFIAGTYTITLTVTDSEGNQGSDSVILTIE